MLNNDFHRQCSDGTVGTTFVCEREYSHIPWNRVGISLGTALKIKGRHSSTAVPSTLGMMYYCELQGRSR